MATSLTARHISSPMAAADEFGNQESGGLLVAQPSRDFCCVPYLVVPEGFYALVHRSGQEITTPSGSPVWPAGYMCADPFTRVEYLVTKQFIVFDAPVKNCKTKDNVSVTIDVSVVFRIMGDDKQGEDPELVHKFVHNVTPMGLENQLRDALAEEIRTLARRLKHTEVHSCRTGYKAVIANEMTREAEEALNGQEEGKQGGDGEGGAENEALGFGRGEESEAPAPMRNDALAYDVADEMRRRLDTQFREQGVEIHDVMIQNVSLPYEISEQMTNRTMVYSKQDYDRMEQVFEMQAIRLKNETDAMNLSYHELQERARAEGSKMTQILKDQLAEKTAVRTREFNEYEQQTRMEEAKIRAECDEELLKLDLEKQQVLQKVKLEAREQAETLVANHRAELEEFKAEAHLSISRLKSEAKVLLSDAEFKSDERLVKSREWQLRNKQLDVYANLAENQEVVLSSSSDPDENRMLLADSILSNEGQGQSQASVVAQLNLLRLAGHAYGLRQGNYIPGSNEFPDEQH